MADTNSKADGMRSKQTAVDRVRTFLELLIEERGLKPGDKLPTEPDLAESCGVSRATARAALRHLEQSGRAHAVQGHGRYLSSVNTLRVERPITKYESSSDMLGALGYEVQSRVLSVGAEPATEKVAEALGISTGASVIKLVRLRLGNGMPLIFSTNYILHSALPGSVAQRDWSGTITGAIELSGGRLTSAVARISAVELAPQWMQQFELHDLGPWLLVEEVCLADSGLRVLYAEDYHRGSEISFNLVRIR